MVAAVPCRVVVVLSMVLGARVAEAQATADTAAAEVPPGVIAAGKQVFLGDGLCLACHGADAKGSIGPDLTDSLWLIGTGTLPEIIARIVAGVSADQSKLGQTMPPRGGSGLTDEQVRAVAAYVWSLSRKPSRT